MKKILVLCILFLCSSWPIFAADSDYVCVHHENIDLNLTRELEKYLYLHFTKDFGHLPVAIVDATHIHFKNDPDVFAFYNPNDNYIYFKDKDIVNKLNDKYILNSVIHELTHFYQNNYGNKLPEGGTPNWQARLLYSKNREIIIRHNIETLKQWEIIYSKTVTDNGWGEFLKGAIAEGTACLVGTFISNTFWVQDSWFDVPQTVEDVYLDIYIPICIAYNRAILKDRRWDIIAQTYKTMVLHRRKRGIGNSELEEYQISYNPVTLFGGITFTHWDFRKSLKKITLKQLLKSVERN